ncbi:hypothetical protein F5876DRAFT_83872 [Lentinula aff. lateritia]|uniref:Uncharacterized protein n=1 Tax=Lentinula aff. lateritia TaxID=2804960 RepID=A0ACC1THI4_9AGAR|nr:hypothetical protein F5876DRAFT_83872 [Lentinula aff. lateritia]
MESQLAQGLANIQSLWEVMTRTNQYLHQLLRRQDEMNGRLIAIETRLAMASLATPGPSSSKEEEEEKSDEEESEDEDSKEEGGKPAPKKVQVAELEKEGGELALKMVAMTTSKGEK